MYIKHCFIQHTPTATNSNEFIPLASPVESSKIRATCAARLSNIFHLSSHRTPGPKTIAASASRVDLTSGQHPKHPHASHAATSPTELSRHECLYVTDEGTGSTNRTYRHRKCRTCVVKSTSGAQRIETEAPARSTSYSAATIEGFFFP